MPDWDKFFELLGEIVNQTEGKSWQERRDEVKRRASACGLLFEFDEFVGWFTE